MLLTTSNDVMKLNAIQPQLKTISDFINNWQQEPWQFKEERLSDKVIVRLLSYKTDTFTNRSWEAHNHEIDLHFLLEGNERIYLADSSPLSAGEYHEEEDYYLLEGTSARYITLNSEPGKENFLLLWTQEAHKTGVQDMPIANPVKKMVFKIRN